jgi:choice-of-anchor B domain-containing protein
MLFAAASSADAQSMRSATQAAQQGFGASVAVSGGNLFVGEAANQATPGMVYAYERDASGAWSEMAALTSPDAVDGDGFGGTLAVDGSTLVTASTSADEGTGAVYVYTSEGGSWTFAQKLSASDGVAGDQFGVSVDLSGDQLLVGAWAASDTAGAVYTFARDASGSWAETGKLSGSDAGTKDRFGVVLTVDGDLALVSATRAEEQMGAVYAFGLVDGAWTAIGQLEPRGLEKGDRFGSSLLINGDNVYASTERVNRFVGAVFAFTRDDDDGDWNEIAGLQPFDAAQQTRFGVALAATDGELWVGAIGTHSFAGSVYRFEADGQGGWASADKLAASDLQARDVFGAAFDIEGDLAAVSAVNSDFGLGSVYVFNRDSDGQWIEDTELFTSPGSLDAVVGGQVSCADGDAAGFECGEVDLVSFVPVADLGGGRGVNLNDIWGWTDPETGHEWALVGRMDGTSFVDVTNPEAPVVVANLPKTPGTNSAAWRDIKVHDGHAFIVADGAGQHGMQIFDLNQLRTFDASGGAITVEPTAFYDGVASVHNIVINEETGFAYAVGSNQGGETCGGGLHMIDIRSPQEPTFAGCFADASTGRQKTGYSHDAQCLIYHGPDAEYTGREICLGANETALSIADVTDKDNPVAVSMATYPNVGYTHQGWFDEEHRYFYMNDELDEMQGLVDRTRTLVWDLSDLDDPILVTEHMGTQPSIDHNLYIKGDLMYQSNYMSGLRVLDISDRANPVEVGFFDTVPTGDNSPSFGGSWSNYPFFESGTIVVTSGSEGLFVLKKKEGRPVS